MITEIHERLLDWAEASGGDSAASNWSRLLSGCVGGGQGGPIIPFSDEVYQTEKAVYELEESQKRIVLEFYLNVSSTLEQKLDALGMSKRTLYRRLNTIHEEIESYLCTEKY